MPVSVSPSPSEGSLTPSGTPPSVAVTITMPLGGRFNASLVAGGKRVLLETGLLGPGHSQVRLFLPAGYPPGSTLVLRIRDVGGSSGSFAYPL